MYHNEIIFRTSETEMKLVFTIGIMLVTLQEVACEFCQLILQFFDKRLHFFLTLNFKY